MRLATAPSPIGPIFVNNRGGAFVIETIQQHFRVLVHALELAAPGQRCPGLHDWRHTFATGHMVAAYTHGSNPARTLSLLSSSDHTHWYLSTGPRTIRRTLLKAFDQQESAEIQQITHTDHRSCQEH